MSTIAPPITDAQERVRRGAALLDAHGPEHWRYRVDLDRFNINHCNECILGQVYGHYTTGLRALGLDKGAEYGFTSHVYGVQTAWREELGA